MLDPKETRVAIVDYGLGNLFSIKRACERGGMHALITASPREILKASAVILPGVGAFGDAMETLEKLDLVSVLRDVAASHKPLIGICLGMQLLMTGSCEFGWHRGLGIIEGEVCRLEASLDGRRRLKVPHVGWNRIWATFASSPPDGGVYRPVEWKGTLLEGLSGGVFMYFVHSYYPVPVDSSVVLSATQYGRVNFCSSLRRGNIYAFQFHPERSGPNGLHIYGNLAAFVTRIGAEYQHA